MAVRLRVLILSAQNLRGADFLGTSDPYVKVEIVGPTGEVKDGRQTQVIEQNLNPVWNEEHELTGFEQSDSLKFSVLDKDHLRGPDFLGKATLTATDFYPAGFDGDLTLSEAGKGHSPRLRVRVFVVGVPQMDAMLDAHMGPPTASLDRPPEPTPDVPIGSIQSIGSGFGSLGSISSFVPPGGSPQGASLPAGSFEASGPVRRLTVRVKYATRLRDDEWRGRMPDAYVLTRSEGRLEKQTTFSTKVVKGSANPVWEHEEQFDYEIGRPLNFEVYDKQVYPNRDELLGRFQLTAEDFMPDGLSADVPLVDTGEAGAYAMLGLEIIAGQGWAANSVTMDTSAMLNASYPQIPSSGGPSRLLVLDVISAEGIEPRSPCYAVCSATGPEGAQVELCRTHSVPERRPTWNFFKEVLFYYTGSPVVFKVLDQDRMLGSATIFPDSMLPGSQLDKELPLEMDGQRTGGKLHVRVLLNEAAATTSGLLQFAPRPSKPLLGTGRLHVVVKGANLTRADGTATSAARVRLFVTVESSDGSSSYRTPIASSATRPVWNHRYEIEDFSGDGIQFTVFDGELTLGKAQLRSEAFDPYGYDADLTISDRENHQGIVGLLGVSVRRGNAQRAGISLSPAGLPLQYPSAAVAPVAALGTSTLPPSPRSTTTRGGAASLLDFSVTSGIGASLRPQPVAPVSRLSGISSVPPSLGVSALPTSGLLGAPAAAPLPRAAAPSSAGDALAAYRALQQGYNTSSQPGLAARSQLPSTTAVAVTTTLPSRVGPVTTTVTSQMAPTPSGLLSGLPYQTEALRPAAAGQYSRTPAGVNLATPQPYQTEVLQPLATGQYSRAPAGGSLAPSQPYQTEALVSRGVVIRGPAPSEVPAPAVPVGDPGMAPRGTSSGMFALRKTLMVCIVGAQNLRSTEAAGLQDPSSYCVMQVNGAKALQTEVVNNNPDPVWNHEAEVSQFGTGDQVTMTVLDRDFGEALGSATLTSSMLEAGFFEGELQLNSSGSTLIVRVIVTEPVTEV